LAAPKARLSDRNRKTVNNVLGILGHTLKTAARWKVLDRVPCSVRMLKVSGGLPRFYDFDDYKRLAETAGAVDARTHVVVLLGGDAGLRRGEMLGLRRGRRLQATSAAGAGGGLETQATGWLTRARAHQRHA
jgi:integrase